MLAPVFEATAGVDGYVSLEVDPELAYERGPTFDEAKRLTGLVARPNLRTMLSAEPEQAVAGLPAGAFVLCMTQGHATDLPIVRQLLAAGRFAFIGVIGSEPKARTLRGALLKEGFGPAAVEAIRCPVGLPIGSNAPAEIAVSIAAQLLQVRDGDVG